MNLILIFNKMYIVAININEIFIKYVKNLNDKKYRQTISYIL